MKANYSITFPFSIDKFGEKIKQSFLGISLLVILQLLLSVTIQAQDVPLSVVNTFYGNYDQNLHGVTMYPDITSNSFDIDLPSCASGSGATITNAYFVWQQRFRNNNNDLGTVPVFDNSFDLQIGSNSVVSITADSEYTSINPENFNGSLIRYTYLFTGYADVTSMVQSELVAGTNTINVSDLIPPTETGVTKQNWGIGLVLIYECPEYPEVTIQTSVGSDFFYCGNVGGGPDAGDYSHINCFEFPTTTSPITATLEGMFGGSANESAPYRGGVICYTADSGAIPVNSGTDVAPSGDVVNDPAAVCSDNPTWTSSLGTEWDDFATPVTIPVGSEYVCIQSHSIEDPGVTAGCGSLAAATYVFKFDGDPFQMGTPCDPILETVCDDATDSATLTADAGMTNYQWYNEAGILAGETSQTLVVDSNTPGMADGSEDFYYEATDASGCPGELCCPVTVATEVCGTPCTTPNCFGISGTSNN